MESLPPFAMTQEVLGIAFSSPIFTSPGLLGKQGWSPCSSDCHSDGGESLGNGSPTLYSSTHYNRLTLLNSFAPAVASRHLSWPLPPTRQAWGKTHNYSRPRAMSASGPPDLINTFQMAKDASNAYNAPHSPQESSSSHSISTPGSEHNDVSSFKRFFSAPNREVISMLGEAIDQNGLPPIMPDATFKNSEWDDAEAVKLNRLHASFSLLGLRPTTVQQHVLFQDDDNDKTIQTSVTIPDLGLTGDGLGLSELTIKSPELERSASSLEEQMAFASGLGVECNWSAAELGIRASSDNYLPMSATILTAQEEDFLAVHNDMTTQEDRRMASRHIRQNVAARKQSLDHLGRDVAKISEPVRILHAPFDMDEPLCLSLDSALQRNLSTRSTGASTIMSNDSPIIGGMLSADSYDSLVGLASLDVHREITRQRDSLTLDLEYSYLASDSDFIEAQLAADEDEADQTITADAAGTMTASQSAFDMSFTGSAKSMSALPSPTLEASSCFPESSPLLTVADVEELPTPHAAMTHSFSSTSILDRPRPRAPTAAPSIFARSDLVDVLRTPTQAKRRFPTSASTSQMGSLKDTPAKKSTAKMTPSQTMPMIPLRSVSLEVHPDVDIDAQDSKSDDGKSTESASPAIIGPSVWSPSSPMPASILKTRKSMGYLSPVGHMQLQEVCELKQSLQAEPKAKRTMAWLHNKPAAMSVDQLDISERRQPQGLQQKRSASVKSSVRRVSSKRFLPTLFTARTPSQRVTGQTGIPATEPRNLALARLGMKLGFGTRSAHVEAMPQRQTAFPQSRSMTSLPLTGNHSMMSLNSFHELPAINETKSSRVSKKRRHPLRQSSEEDVCNIDAALPDGFVLVSEVSTVTVERTLA